MADEESGSPIPDVPEFSVTYEGEALLCSPIELIKKKTHKDLVKYQCQKKYVEKEVEKKQLESRGHEETKRLYTVVKNERAQGTVYSLEIPLYAAKRPERARLLAEQELNNRPYGKYLRMIMPAAVYQFTSPVRQQWGGWTDGIA